MYWTLFLLLSLPAILLMLAAQARVQSTFGRFAKVGTRSGMSGADVARLLLRARGLDAVKVERAHGFLTDHYDPTTKTLRLSEATHDSRSVSAIGVAAHETGHALQHADLYAPLQFRSAIVPVVSFANHTVSILLMLAIFTGSFAQGGALAWIVVLGLAAIALFSLITLPVEFNASTRALRLLDSSGILVGDELVGARKVLNAAALTYVAGAAGAIMELLKWGILLFGGGQGSDE